MLSATDPHPPTTPRPLAVPPTTATAPSSIDDLEHELTTLAAHLNAGNYRFLTLLAEFDRRGGHVGWGIASCAHWLTWKCGIGLVAAREKVRVARALEGLPRLGDAMRRGVLSYCKVRALTRIATPDNEDYLLSIAEVGTVSHVEKTVRLFRSDAHHIHHWADGGETKLDNLVLLCRRHHRAVHELGFQVEREGTRIRFQRPNGCTVPQAPGMVPLDRDGWLSLKQAHAQLGLQVDARTTVPTWRGERMDYNWAIGVLQGRAERGRESAARASD